MHVMIENAPTPKILILGTSESGKSTLLKALRLCLQEPYTLDERLSYREIIWSNVVQSARVVLEAMESLELPLENDTNEYHVQTIFMQPSQYEDCPPGSEVIHAVKLLWDDAGFQDAFNRRREYQLPDSFRYYAIDVERIMSPDYVPTNEDIFRSRVKTTGITESSFLYNDLGYKVFDVGGVRSERKKWIHVFGNISTVAFTIDAHSYAKILFEDETVNRMQEQLHLFDSVVNSRWFQESSFIIVFTKIDMLEEWLQTNPAEQYFPGYSRNSSLGLVESYMQYLGDRRGPGLEVWGSVEELAHSRQLGTTLEAQSGNLS
ncbi:G-protein complex alpha subunit GpaA/FadA [Lentithecium fluviatile CBS 122367]|uniref:G-protein complex alpha subunit GpaA/FadA n=1 Tax=Lentithecium fluviatile CBS 122367 TaxID=1168545 RepID=A0A6G1JI49_9PLEO|nr:G-protein complex alpha subunit GpaA/FadA [Lentithecium fluviatile CBS 122367]